MSTPQTTIYICAGVPIDNTYRHTLYFDSVEAQRNYFSGKVVKTFPDYSYCRKTWEIKVAATMNQARTWSYLYFINPNDSKYWYYFVTNVEYVNDDTVRVSLELDVMQTYLFNIRDGLRPCFVERITPASDRIGAHTVDEGLELGTFTDNRMTDFDELETLVPIIMATERVHYNNDNEPAIVTNQPPVTVINGVACGAFIMVCVNEEQLKLTLKEYSEAGATESILSIWLYPKKLISVAGYTSWEQYVDHSTGGTGVFRVGTPGLIASIESMEYHINPLTAIDGYQPKNKKLFTHPFNFLYVTNNNGGYAEYKHERFNGNDKYFDVIGSPFPDGGTKIIPRNYNNVGFNHDEGLTLTNYPTCAFSGDYYKIWLAQNQNTYNAGFVAPVVSIVGGVAGIAAGAYTANPMLVAGGVGGVVGGFNQVNSLIAQKKDVQSQPNQARGAQSPSINACNSKHTFSFYYRSVNYERAKIIDDYFTMYGYKENCIMSPNLKARERFTYIKTVDCFIDANLCNDDKRKIISVFDAGITFWADVNGVGDYETANGFIG